MQSGVSKYFETMHLCTLLENVSVICLKHGTSNYRKSEAKGPESKFVSSEEADQPGLETRLIRIFD